MLDGLGGGVGGEELMVVLTRVVTGAEGVLELGDFGGLVDEVGGPGGVVGGEVGGVVVGRGD